MESENHELVSYFLLGLLNSNQNQVPSASQQCIISMSQNFGRLSNYYSLGSTNPRSEKYKVYTQIIPLPHVMRLDLTPEKQC